MARESEYKQVKLYLIKYGGMSDELAQRNADKINRASRVYKNIPMIIQKCANWGVDARDLTLTDLHLAIQLS